jgi:hypothetical protein
MTWISTATNKDRAATTSCPSGVALGSASSISWTSNSNTDASHK